MANEAARGTQPSGASNGGIASGGGEARPNMPRVHMQGNLVAGTAVGVLQAVLFNPWDRALYLSVKEKRPFLIRANFTQPYQGLESNALWFVQAAVQRTISGGLYFVLQGIVADVVQHGRKQGDPAAKSDSFVVGLVAGTLNGALLNPLAAVKYHNWGSEFTWRGSLRHALAHGGPAVLVSGMGSTVMRDATFGVCYEVGRDRLRVHSDHLAWQVASAAGAAALATVFSSPFNYVRSIQYAHMTDEEPKRRIVMQLGRLWANAKKEPSPLRYLAQRLRIGWGTARVATSMALAQLIFAEIKEMSKKKQ